MIEVLVVVSSARSGKVFAPLARACQRRGVSWACFFTHQGVALLTDPELLEALPPDGRAIACEHSWQRYMGKATCPVSLGSQTNHSALIAEAAKVVAL